MRLFHFSGTSHTKPAWTFAPGGIVWRLFVSDDRVIVGEARWQEEKRVEFFGVDELTGLLLWRVASLPDPWWTGLEGLHRGVVLLHGFAEPDMPEHLGVWACDVRDGRRLWEAPDLTFWFAAEGRVYGVRNGFDRRLGVSLDLTSGAVAEEFGESLESLYALRQRSAESEIPSDVQFPVLLEAAGLPATVAERISRMVPHDRRAGEIEVIQRDDRVVVSFHRRLGAETDAEPRLENRLVMLDARTRKVLFEDVIQHDARAAVPDSFFVKGDQVLFVKDGSTLTALSLHA